MQEAILDLGKRGIVDSMPEEVQAGVGGPGVCIVVIVGRRQLVVGQGGNVCLHPLKRHVRMSYERSILAPNQSMLLALRSS